VSINGFSVSLGEPRVSMLMAVLPCRNNFFRKSFAARESQNAICRVSRHNKKRSQKGYCSTVWGNKIKERRQCQRRQKKMPIISSQGRSMTKLLKLQCPKRYIRIWCTHTDNLPVVDFVLLPHVTIYHLIAC
jgi:hypothetical protein